MTHINRRNYNLAVHRMRNALRRARLGNLGRYTSQGDEALIRNALTNNPRTIS